MLGVGATGGGAAFPFFGAIAWLGSVIANIARRKAAMNVFVFITGQLTGMRVGVNGIF